jgi:hypothetical protein
VKERRNMRIGSRDIPLPALGAAGAALIAIIVVVVLAVASGGGDDDDGDSATADRTVAANRTAVSQSRTRIPLTSTAIAEARATAIAQGTPEDAFDAANPTPTTIPTQVPPQPSDGTATVTTPDETAIPEATESPILTPTPAESASPTPIPAGFIGTITLDVNGATEQIEHSDVSAIVGDTFDVTVVIHDPPQGYQGYQYGIAWEDNGILSFVEESRFEPEDLSLCTEPVDLETTIAEPNTGVYGGCLNPDPAASITYEGATARLTFSCEQTGRIRVRPLSMEEADPFGSALLGDGGTTIDGGVDNGFEVVCA